MKSAIYVSGPVDDPSVKGDLRNVMMCIRDVIINCNLLLSISGSLHFTELLLTKWRYWFQICIDWLRGSCKFLDQSQSLV